MRFRKLALAVSVVGALGSQMASALGLGEIELKSTLNQPLNAEIKLLHLRDLGEREILVDIASSADFQRAGVDRTFFLNDLKFDIIIDNPTGPIIKVTSSKLIREPFLNFILETQWPNGRILREYTLLMDLPVFEEGATASIQAPAAKVKVVEKKTVKSEQEPIAQPDKKTSQQSSYSSSVQQQPSTPHVYGPVSSSDTLWAIALKARPSGEFSVQQTMLAIQHLNPEAFIDGNINLLRKGQVLRLPTGKDISSVGGREALVSVARQNDQWSNVKAHQLSGPQIEGSGQAVTDSTEQQQVGGRLKLAPTVNAENVGAGRGAGEVGGDADALQGELVIAQEELDKTRRDSAEYKNRITELEAQIETMERLVNLSNEELRTLQLASKKNDEAANDQAEGDVGSDRASSDDEASVAQADAGDSAQNTAAEEGAVVGALAGDDAEPASGSVISESASAENAPTDNTDQSDQDVSDNVLANNQDSANLDQTKDSGSVVADVVTGVVTEKSAANKVVTTSSSAADEKSLIDQALDYLWWLAGGLLALFVAALFFLRRKSNEEESGEDYDDELDGFMEDEASDLVDEEIDEDECLDDEAFDDEDVFEGETLAADVDPLEGDVVERAEIYLAYGKHDQAEALLLKALERNPADMAVRLKLLEVYAGSNDVDAFDRHYVKILGQDDVVAQMDAAELRERMSEAAPFDGGPETDDSDEELFSGGGQPDLDLDVETDLDFSLDEDLDLASDFDVGTDEVPGDQDIEFDFSLDEPETDTNEALEEIENSLDEPIDDALSGDFELGDSSGVPEESLDKSDEVSIDEPLDFEVDGFIDVEDSIEVEDSIDELELEDTNPVDNTPENLFDESDDGFSDLDLASLDEEMESMSVDFDLEDHDFEALTAEDVDFNGLPEGLSEGLSTPDAPEELLAFDNDDALSKGAAVGLGVVAGSLFGAGSDEAESVEGRGAFDDADSVDESIEEDLTFLADTDEVSTKLDLARVYIDMGDLDGARDILVEVVQEGAAEQKVEAEELLSELS